MTHNTGYTEEHGGLQNDFEEEWIEDFIKKYSVNLVDIKLPKELARRNLNQLLTTQKEQHHQELQKAREEERERIEAIFKESVPPHAMDLEDSVWLKRLLNKAFQHDKNI